jgi:hypothetical protein
MNTWQRSLINRFALWLAFWATGYGFDQATVDLPYNPFFVLLYYGCAATVDLLLFHLTRHFVSAQLRYHIESIFIASIAVNALGWALSALADTPPDLRDFLIAGLNHAFIIRLLLGDGDVLDINYYRSRIYLVLGNIPRHQKYSPTEEK